MESEDFNCDIPECPHLRYFIADLGHVFLLRISMT